MYKKVVSLITMAALAAGLLAGCAGEADNAAAPVAADGEYTAQAAVSNEGGEATGEEEALAGSIVVYTALEDELVTEYLADFNAKYPGIQVNVVRESTGVITAKLIAESDNPQADAVWGTAASSLMVLETMGALEPYAPAGVESILPQFKSDSAVPTWVGIDAWETAIIVNTEEAEKLGLPEITSYEDLLDPAFAGHIVMSNPNSSGTGLLTVTGLLQLYGEEGGWEYLQALDSNVAMYVHSGSKPAKMAASGEAAVGISFGYAGISQQSLGAPVEVIFPSEGSGWDLEANALLKKDETNELAKVFLDWAISDDAMNLYKNNYPIIANGGGGSYEGISGDPIDQLIENDFVWVATNREGILADWMDKFDAKSEEQ